MKKNLIVILTCGCIALTACSLSNSPDKAGTAASTVSESLEKTAINEEPAETSSNFSSGEPETMEKEQIEEDESAPEESTAEAGTEDAATAALTAAESPSSLDMEEAFALAGIIVEKSSNGYLLTYPAGSLSEQKLAELEESYGSNNIILNNDDGSVTFRLTDDEYSYMTDTFNQSRNPSAE